MEHIEQKITSMEVAEMVGKGHKELLRDVRRYSEQLGQSKIALSDFWEESSYTSEQNKELPCFMVTKKGCEFIAHKLTGVKGTEFTAKYINRFHEMEAEIKKPITALEQIHNLFAQGLLEVEQKADAAIERVDNLENTLPLLGVDCDIVTNAVKAKGLEVLGGKDSNAYKDKSLRSKVYSDIHRELKRQFGVSSYKAIRRNQIEKALEIIANYEPPMALAEEIAETNAQMRFGGVE